MPFLLYKATSDVYDYYKIFDRRNTFSHFHDIGITLTTGEAYSGVKTNSVLNTLNYYHNCNPGLPPCIAHDLFEDVVQYV